MTTTFIDDINEVLAQWAEGVISGIRQNLETTGTNASGKTSASLKYVVGNGELTIFGRPYFRSVEEGRGPGGIPYRFTDILYEWAQAKGILSNFGDTEAKQRSALYMVGQFIKRNGTSLFRKGGRDDIYSSVINDEMPKLNEMLTATITETIINDLPKKQ